MSDSKKLFTPREAALAVLARTKAILEESSLAKSEKLKKDGPTPTASPTPNSAASGIMAGFNSMGAGGGGAGSTSMPKSEMKKYETENKKEPSKAKELPSKELERDFKNFEVQKESPNSSKDDKRQEKQVSPSGNPKESGEGNNKPDGMEPEFEFKNKVAKELAKEKASHMVKSQSGMHTVMYQTATIQKSEKEENDLKKAEPLEKGDWKKIHDKLKREGYSEESANKIDGSIKAKLGKNENPDKDADAQLGEKVEHDVEQHVQENEAAEAQEGNSMAKPGDKMEGQTERASIPMCIGSAKLSKFMEYKHSKRKNAQAQAPAAVGQPAANAPQPGSTQTSNPDPTRPKTQPTTGDQNKV